MNKDLPLSNGSHRDTLYSTWCYGWQKVSSPLWLRGTEMIKDFPLSNGSHRDSLFFRSVIRIFPGSHWDPLYSTWCYGWQKISSPLFILKHSRDDRKECQSWSYWSAGPLPLIWLPETLIGHRHHCPSLKYVDRKISVQSTKKTGICQHWKSSKTGN